MNATTLLLLTLLHSPWNVGPAPSAHAVDPGLSASVTGVAFVGGPDDVRGGRFDVAWAPHERIFTSLSAQPGAGWTTCPDCRTNGLTLTARGTIIRHPNLQLTAWMVGTTTPYVPDWTPGVALEGGSRRLRFDTTWPLWSTFDLLTTLRITPEVGVSYTWSVDHRTRVALVGLEPAVAVQHRWTFVEDWSAEATLRQGEEGTGIEIGVRWHP